MPRYWLVEELAARVSRRLRAAIVGLGIELVSCADLHRSAPA
jgi:hypothetical protein